MHLNVRQRNNVLNLSTQQAINEHTSFACWYPFCHKHERLSMFQHRGSHVLNGKEYMISFKSSPICE